MSKLEEFNQKISDSSVGVYPFVGKHRVTTLKRGFYKKDKANYRGISMIWDREKNKLKAMLIGYYFIDKDTIIVPDDLELTEGMEKFINLRIQSGYSKVNRVSFPPFEFSEGSEEYLAALEAKNKYND